MSRCAGIVWHAAVIAVLRNYDDRESKMIPLIETEKSMLKALAIDGRY